jgi:hypothetical protein
MEIVQMKNMTITVPVPSSNGGPPGLPRAVRRLRSLSCETQRGTQRFTRQHLMRVERFRRRLTPRGRQVFGHLTLVELAVILHAIGDFLTEPEI